MEDYQIYLILTVIGIGIIVLFFSWIFEIRHKVKKYDELKPKLDNLEYNKHQLYLREAEFKKSQLEWEEEVEKQQIAWKEKIEKDKFEWEEKVKANKNYIEIVAKEKSKGFPWLADAYAKYFYLQSLKEADYLDNKKHHAPVSADKVREIARKRRIIEKKLRIAQGIINYYQDLFPFLEDLLGETEDEMLLYILSRNIEEPVKDVGEIGIDPVRIYLSHLSEEEYQKLSSTERNQLALDRYWTKRKNNWQLGRDYERYTGYLFESKGYNVYYQGIMEGFDDLGRDLICKKEEETIIVQCKRWSHHKTIHEKHVNQLYGTLIKYRIDHPIEKVSALLCTTTVLSDRAKEFAKYLDVKIKEEFTLQTYPSIKCNISRRNGEKIYHLPFDQQYDRTLIEEERNECYIETVKEAEELGFRRAWKWKGVEVE
jgi:hypothetical protein